MTSAGLHHVTAIASNVQHNYDFYTNVLGLRLVKKTVNFDDLTSYHTYFGDESGSPGTIITFFPIAGVPRGRIGAGHTAATAYNIPIGSSGYWKDRLTQLGVAGISESVRFGGSVVGLDDPDGLPIELIEHPSNIPAYASVGVSQSEALRGFHSVTLLQRSLEPTAQILTNLFGYRAEGVEDDRHRFTTSSDEHGRIVDVIVDPDARRGMSGGGTVHHVAFRAKDDAEQLQMLETVYQMGWTASPVMDRNYFHSIYFRIPSGTLFEIATDSPGMTIDEPLATLGESLRLPPTHEKNRAEIESVLPKLQTR